MALVLRELYKSYVYFNNDARDSRLEHYFLMGSVLKPVGMTLAFLYFVRSLGPKMMENRKPFELKTVMAVYNLFQVISNFILAFVGIYLASQHNLKCMTVDYSNTPGGLLEAKATYYYYILKVTDLLDTVFFVLRKKYHQVSFLHLYHHSFMVMGSFIYANYVPGGHVLGLGILNCCVHVVMYLYYLLTSLKSDLKWSIWWKKHITQVQLTQFALLIIHFGHPLVFGNCSYPKTWLFVPVIQNLFMLVLFSDFYYKAYIKKSKKNNEKVE